MTRAAHAQPLQFDTIDDVTAKLRDGGGRLSAARRLILEALFDADAPVSAEGLANKLRLDLSSVYRNLEHLETLGVVRHVHLGHGPGLHALVGRGEREYLVCERCDQVTAVTPDHLNDIRAAIQLQFGFRASFSHFPILGVCADCQASDPTSADTPHHDGAHDHERRTHSAPTSAPRSGHAHTDHQHGLTTP